MAFTGLKNKRCVFDDEDEEDAVDDDILLTAVAGGMVLLEASYEVAVVNFVDAE